MKSRLCLLAAVLLTATALGAGSDERPQFAGPTDKGFLLPNVQASFQVDHMNPGEALLDSPGDPPEAAAPSA